MLWRLKCSRMWLAGCAHFKSRSPQKRCVCNASLCVGRFSPGRPCAPLTASLLVCRHGFVQFRQGLHMPQSVPSSWPEGVCMSLGITWYFLHVATASFLPEHSSRNTARKCVVFLLISFLSVVSIPAIILPFLPSALSPHPSLSLSLSLSLSSQPYKMVGHSPVLAMVNSKSGDNQVRFPTFSCFSYLLISKQHLV